MNVSPGILAATGLKLVQDMRSAVGNENLTMVELGSIFRYASGICDEAIAFEQRLDMANKIKNWKPGQ